jgi:hypothetical protein
VRPWAAGGADAEAGRRTGTARGADAEAGRHTGAARGASARGVAWWRSSLKHVAAPLFKIEKLQIFV